MKQAIKNIFIILTPREKQESWLLAMADVVVSILDILFLFTLLYLIRYYTQQDQHLNSKWLSRLISVRYPQMPILLFFALFTLKNASGFFVAKKQYRFIYSVASRISGEMMKRYLHGSYKDYVAVDSSVTNRSISQQPVEFAHYVLNAVQQVFSQCMLAGITVVAIFLVNPLLVPLLVIMIAPPLLLVQRLLKEKLVTAGIQGKKISEQTMQLLQEGLQGFVESNLHQKNHFFINRYHRLQVQLNHYLSTRLIIQNMPPRLIEIFAVFGLLLLIMVNTLAGQGHSIGLVTIGALMVAAYKVIPGIVKITNMVNQVKVYSYAAEALASAAAQLKERESNHERIMMLSCTDIAFNYADKEILNHFDTCLQPKDFMVLSGNSGKGKTTLFHLLLGFLSPSAGSILINNKITDDKGRQQYWPRIAYVKQQPFFLHASVLENICLSQNIDDQARLQQALDLSGLTPIIGELPAGIDTIITENGKNFSGGQRQRIAFARAFYKDADVMLLDEPFSELEETSERELLQVLRHVANQGKIVMLITHNSTALEFGNKKINLH